MIELHLAPHQLPGDSIFGGPGTHQPFILSEALSAGYTAADLSTLTLT